MTEKKNNIKILISCHKPTEYIENEIMQPIQLGCANAKERFKSMLHDDDGDNISSLNPMYCELTAQYWAWKNLDADYYGFCHYRRYFNFSDELYKEDAYGNVIEQYPGEYCIEKYKLDEKSIEGVVGDYDIIITERKNIRKMPEHYYSVFSQYENAPYLNKRDIHTLIDIIDEKYPDYSIAAHKFCKGHITSFCNMYILKKDIFFEYCSWMFSVLKDFCDRTEMDKYSTEALRTPGHLSERLFGIFLAKKISENPNLRVKELQCVYFSSTDPQNSLAPAFEENNVPVVFAANNNFVPMFATCLQSVMDHSSKSNNYDIILIQSDVDQYNRLVLMQMVKPYENFSLRFFDASRLLAGHKLKANAHISVETYYRFLIQTAMPSYKKVLYMDCDLIVKKDIADLYKTDVNGYMLAATHDPDFIGQINGANEETQRYIKYDFKIKNPYEYFQAGVILFNEDEMRKSHSLEEWLTYASHRYRYNDQDVLNLYCEGKVKNLDMSWNTITDCNHERINDVIKYAPNAIQKEYQKAHANPKIIHYAGFKKPWHSANEDYASDFWVEARKTPYYEQLIEIMQDSITNGVVQETMYKTSFKSNAYDHVVKAYQTIFPLDSTADIAIRRLLGKGSKKK